MLTKIKLAVFLRTSRLKPTQDDWLTNVFGTSSAEASHLMVGDFRNWLLSVKSNGTYSALPDAFAMSVLSVNRLALSVSSICVGFS